jgi:hypothetical protein
MWHSMRDDVVAYFPPQPAQSVDPNTYLARIANVYCADAYHSLSIEGYNVTDALSMSMHSMRRAVVETSSLLHVLWHCVLVQHRND